MASYQSSQSPIATTDMNDKVMADAETQTLGLEGLFLICEIYL